MGKPAFRVGDATSGHQPFPSRKAIVGSPNVIINGRPAVRALEDQLEPHCVGFICHTLAVAKGSTTVRINGFDATRIGDIMQCGEYAVIGSENILIGD
ncbi:MAG: PAAR domain-containing protein [Candidatus Peribacteraceae bacterium]|nr:PAAR domain-containing protein [Candidatus Peribacteraceae bacterium]